MDINASLLGQAFTFAILVLFTMKFVWPPLTKIIDERTQRITEGLAAAEKGRHDLALADKGAAEKLRKAKAQAADIIAQAQKQAALLVEEAHKRAQIEGERVLAATRAEAGQWVAQARHQLSTEVAELAIAGAEKILKREVDRQTHEALLNALQSEL